MPEARRETQTPDSQDPGIASEDRQMSAGAVMSTFEQICVAMPASGALIAVRNSQGVRCVVSFGDAPAVGSQLQSDSTFTRECIETGTTVLCDDAEQDSRIQPSIARTLNFRSAVAVPIQVQGSVVGLIEVFSSRPSSIYPTAVTALERVANLFAPLLSTTFGSGPVGQPTADGSALDQVQSEASPSAARAQTLSAAGDQTEHQLIVSESSAERADHPSPQWVGSEPSLATDPVEEIRRVIKDLQTLEARKSETPTSPWLAWRMTPARAWLVGLAALLSVAFLFGIMQSRRKGWKSLTPTAVVPPVSDRATSQRLRTGPSESVGQNPAIARAAGGSTSNDPAQNKVAADVPNSRTVPTPSRDAPPSAPLQPRDVETEIPRGLKPPSLRADREVSKERLSELVTEAPGPDPPALPAMPPPDFLGATPNLGSPIRPANTSSPDFVLHRTVKAHSGWVTGVAFSSQGQLASGGWDQTLRFWDVLTGQELRGFSGKIKQVQALAFSRDGRWLAAENSSDTVSLWDVTSGSEIRTLPSDKPVRAAGTSWVYSIAFSPDGRWLASGVDDKTVRLWDLTTGSKARDLISSRRSVIYIAFSPDGRLLASGNDDRTIRIWEVSTGDEIMTLSGHQKPIYAVAFSPSGHWLASASGDKTVKLWEVATGRAVRTFTGHHNAVTSLAFSPDGRWLASGSWDKTIKLWDVATGNELQTLGPNAHSIYTIAFDPRGRWLASGSEDGMINIWRLNDARNRTGSPADP
jgi:WD40 repeat protein